MGSSMNYIEKIFEKLKLNENYIKNIEKDITSISNKKAKLIY